MANDFILEGKLFKVFEPQQVTATFTKRSFVVETTGTYPQFVQLELKQDKCNLIDGYKIGEVIEVNFNLEGREWQGKYFTNISAWKIARIGEKSSNPKASSPAAANTPASEDELPF